MRTRTKIVCTIGPACRSLERIIELIHAGMQVARLNFSHGTHEEHAGVIAVLKEARSQLRVPLAIMLDNKGPEIRIGRLTAAARHVHRGDHLHLVAHEVAQRDDEVPIRPGSVIESLHTGMTVLFNDGFITSHVVEVTGGGVVVEVDNDGEIAPSKGVNIPDAALDLPALTERDIADLRFGCQQGIDLFAASFIQNADQVLTIKRLLAEEGAGDTLVMAKIESSNGVRNFDAILQVSDGIMIARGDLGVEVPLEQVPVLQKAMIRKCYIAGKPSFTATQMLESMIERPRPTRAEASDVANAVYDSTSAVMLSGETAVGKYPIEVVRVMDRIIAAAENDFDFHQFFYQDRERSYEDVPSSVALASLKTAYSCGAKALFVVTSGGGTARLLARLRPEMPILALTSSEKVYHQLACCWGTEPIYAPGVGSTQDAFQRLSSYALENGIVEYGDLVVVTAGVPFGIIGSTNMMVVESIGDVLVRAEKGYGHAVTGELILFDQIELGRKFEVAEGRILLIRRCSDQDLPFLKRAKGVILENRQDDYESEKYLLLASKALGLSTVVRASMASRILQAGQTVTLDPSRGLVYNGRVAL